MFALLKPRRKRAAQIAHPFPPSTALCQIFSGLGIWAEFIFLENYLYSNLQEKKKGFQLQGFVMGVGGGGDSFDLQVGGSWGFKGLMRRKKVDSARKKVDGGGHQLAKALSVPHLIAIGNPFSFSWVLMWIPLAGGFSLVF